MKKIGAMVALIFMLGTLPANANLDQALRECDKLTDLNSWCKWEVQRFMSQDRLTLDMVNACVDSGVSYPGYPSNFWAADRQSRTAVTCIIEAGKCGPKRIDPVGIGACKLDIQNYMDCLRKCPPGSN